VSIFAQTPPNRRLTLQTAAWDLIGHNVDKLPAASQGTALGGVGGPGRAYLSIPNRTILDEAQDARPRDQHKRLALRKRQRKRVRVLFAACEPKDRMMRTHQIMIRKVIRWESRPQSLTLQTSCWRNTSVDFPVVDEAGKLVGIVSQGDFIRRAEIGTQRKRGRWLKFLLGPGKVASDFVHEQSRKVGEIMTLDPWTVTEDAMLEDIVQLMEHNNVKRLPVMREDQLVGIVTRSNLLQAVAELARDIPDPTADDDHIRNHIIRSIEKADWAPFGLGIIVRNGDAHLSGVITDEQSRQAAIVAAEIVTGRQKRSRPPLLGRADVGNVPELSRRRSVAESELR
jgi:CBS domain-containing protein